MITNFYFNALFFKRFFRQLQAIFPKCLCPSTLLFLALVGLLILEQVTVYFVGLMPSKYYAILGGKDFNSFIKQTLISLGLVLAMTVILASKKYVWTQFYIKSRELLSKLLQKLYTTHINFYKINVLCNEVDNVDQRITQDVDKMCLIFGEIVPNLLVTPFNILYYSYATWTVTGFVGPVSVYIFFVVSTVINKLLMSPIVSMAAFQEKQEGEFRYKHVHLRLNSESAAFYRCGLLENVKLEEKLDALLDAQRKLNSRQFFLSLSVHSASYFGSILSYIVIAVPIFKGVYDDLPASDVSSIISKASFLILYLIYNFTRLIEMAPEVANMAGCSHRIGQLFETLLRINSSEEPEVIMNNHQNHGGRFGMPAFIFSRVCVGAAHKTSQPKLLCRDLNLEISSGQNLLITGDSGTGKTSLLRTLEGLWPLQGGRITRLIPRGRRGAFHLPQKPYLTNGSLRDQIAFPEMSLEFTSDEEIVSHLRTADLEELLSRVGSLDSKLDWKWEDVLSPGEAQRLAFVRLFCHRPLIAILDEATSQIGEDLERRLHEHCVRMGMTLVSVGHRKTLVSLHDRELRLHRGGDWSLAALPGRLDVVEAEEIYEGVNAVDREGDSLTSIRGSCSDSETRNCDEARRNLLSGSTRL